jgi:excisionase family DNA binding protein
VVLETPTGAYIETLGATIQIDRTRVYRVKAVADMLDVSPKSIYRAIESGQLDAYKIGTGKGTLRISGQALSVYLDACAQAAFDAYVEGGTNAEVADEDGVLTPAQLDGRACVVCSNYFEDTPTLTLSVPVGHSETGSQVFACAVHADQAAGLVEGVVA